MEHKYVVFDNITELNKDDDLKHSSNFEFQLPIEKSVKYIGNHRVLWTKNRKIIFTLGPHCIFFFFFSFFDLNIKRAFLFIYVSSFVWRRSGYNYICCSKI